MARRDTDIPAEYSRECFLLEPGGIVRWRERPLRHFSSLRHLALSNRFAGAIAGTPRNGYLSVCISYQGEKHTVVVHRIVWVLHTGNWPAQVLDHINRDKQDNRPENLRDVPRDVNARNNGNKRGTGLFGAYAHRSSGRFVSQIMVNKKPMYLGMFDTAHEAHAVALAAKGKQL
jgi:hypothetical protein